VLDFQENLFSNRQNYGVNLTNSDLEIGNNNFELEQTYDILKLGNDSVSDKTLYVKMKNGFSTSNRVFNDNDPLSSIYNDIFLDSISSVDSIYKRELITDISIGFKLKNVKIDIFNSIENVNYFQTTGLDTGFTNLYIGTNAKFSYGKTDGGFRFKYGISGYRKGDIDAKIGINYKIKSNVDLGINVIHKLTEPTLNFVQYSSNHHRWNNLNLNKQSITDINIKLRLKKQKLTFENTSRFINNALYFDLLANAAQNNNVEQLFTWSIAKDYSFSNFYFRTVLKYQQTSDDIIFPLPDLLGRQIVYYQKSIFKKVLTVQIGVGVTYASNYNGYAYAPGLTEFHIQNETELGNYPNIDIFINTHLKRAQIFLKYERINDTSQLDRAFSVPTYPLLGRSLKFGLSWNLFD